MTKYIFNKDYETQVRTSVVGGTGTGTRQIKIIKGTIVDGEEVSKGLTNIKHETTNLSVDSSFLSPYVPYDSSGINPKGMYTPKTEVKSEPNKDVVLVKKTTQGVFTTGNVILVILVLGATFGVLKYKKII